MTDIPALIAEAEKWAWSISHDPTTPGQPANLFWRLASALREQAATIEGLRDEVGNFDPNDAERLDRALHDHPAPLAHAPSKIWLRGFLRSWLAARAALAGKGQED